MSNCLFAHLYTGLIEQPNRLAIDDIRPFLDTVYTIAFLLSCLNKFAVQYLPSSPRLTISSSPRFSAFLYPAHGKKI